MSAAISIDELKHRLLAQVETVAHRYAPDVQGSYTDKGHYFTLNPGRVDRSVGSFYVHVSGPKAGQWRDHATGDYGDILDLIALAMNTDIKGAIVEARAYLGLAHETPELKRKRDREAQAAERRRQEAAARDREAADRRAKQAHALWLSAEPRIKGTPVEEYLRDVRGIDLSVLGRQPRSIRYAPRCFWTETDPETGEVFEDELPAMVALAVDGAGQAVACHRTYLSPESGRWDKAPVRAPKKVLGDYASASIHVWSGTGPRGGKGGPLSQVKPGAHVYIAEGIEDALSAAMILPEARILAGIALGNLGRVALPDNVAEVTLIADQDENDQAKAALERAIATHRRAGRRVRLWQNRHGGKDLNDALRQQRTLEQGTEDGDEGRRRAG